MAIGKGLVEVAVCAGPIVGVSVKVEVGFGVKVAVGDGLMIDALVKIGAAVGKTRVGSARTAPLKRRDMTTSAMPRPVKTYFISEDMGASIRGQARGVKARCGACYRNLKSEPITLQK